MCKYSLSDFIDNPKRDCNEMAPDHPEPENELMKICLSSAFWKNFERENISHCKIFYLSCLAGT